MSHAQLNHGPTSFNRDPEDAAEKVAGTLRVPSADERNVRLSTGFCQTRTAHGVCLPLLLHHRSTACWQIVTVLCFTLFALAPHHVAAVEVEEVIWGFDGQVVPYRFNTLSILVSNPTPDPVDVTLRLTRSTAGADRVGANIDEPVFLSPFASRWVQFYPYMASRWDIWTVSWGRAPSQRHELPEPRLGGLARVTLTESDRMRTSVTSLKSLPEQLFPPLVAATENLEAVFLDHAPRWQEARRQAMLDWLYRGGQLFLLRGEDGEFPQFTGQLAVLNAPLDTQPIGAGRVTRVDRPGDEIDSDFVNQLLGEPNDKVNSSEDWEVATNFFGLLRSMTSPHHAWFAIHAMSIIYLALVFPGWYLLSRARIDYRTTILAFLGVALLFTIAFHVVGRRGYGETTSVNSIALARPVGDGAYDVLQWSNVFVTDGDAYLLKHQGNGHLFSTCQIAEKVNAVIDNGLDGSMIVDIPLFSSRAYLHRSKVQAQPIEFEVEEFEADARLDKLVLVAKQPLPQLFGTARVLYRNTLYRMSQDTGKLWLLGPEQPLASVAALTELPTYWNYNSERPRAQYHQMHGPLMARAVGADLGANVGSFQLPADRVCVFLVTPMTEPFMIHHDKLGKQGGQVVYAIDVLKPDR